MRLCLHIGPSEPVTAAIQQTLARNRAALLKQGVLFPSAPGSGNHARLCMAATDPDHVDPVRYARGRAAPGAQKQLQGMLRKGLQSEIDRHDPRAVILSGQELATTIHRPSERDRLRDFLMQFSDDIHVVLHLDEQARALARFYSGQILHGRVAPLDLELAMSATTRDWWAGCLDAKPARLNPGAGVFAETHAPAFWLDYLSLLRFWEDGFGKGSVTLRPGHAPALGQGGVLGEIESAFGVELTGNDPADPDVDQPSAVWMCRARQINALMTRLLLRENKSLHPKQRRGFLAEARLDGPPIAPGALYAVSDRFRADNAQLAKAHPALAQGALDPDPIRAAWQEPDPQMGFRASQYLLSYLPRIEAANTPAASDDASDTATPPISDAARKIMPPLAIQNYDWLQNSRFAPHDRLGNVDETAASDPYTPVPARRLGDDSTGNVIVACMKNEAPYILEWIAYHRCIGVNNFLIYTNDCSDGTDEILDRLAELGIVVRRANDQWKGKSPQQHALNQARSERLIRKAEWIIHIDVDEYVNVRTGNGTLADFFAAVPEATNVAMTWRLFGHNGVSNLSDRFVIEQFDTCAPRFCPKPHTSWGFKTMFRNIGAYAKMSCHRPNQLGNRFRDKVRWINGSGRDITREAAERGWRSSKRSIGYDLLQLNHYALRSAESFLIKRQRGRALHVDRTIGLNYWVRMDWSDVRDVTIQRNLPRLKAEYDALLQDRELKRWHEHGVQWHRAKAAELREQPEFADLFEQVRNMQLTGLERVAYALSLDHES